MEMTTQHCSFYGSNVVVVDLPKKAALSGRKKFRRCRQKLAVKKWLNSNMKNIKGFLIVNTQGSHYVKLQQFLHKLGTL